MKKTLELFNLGFESSCEKTPQFKEFARVFKKEFKKELESANATNIEFHVGHFEISGFFTVGTQAWYFMFGDVRFHNHASMYYRKVKDYKDYTGEMNQWIEIKTGMGKGMRLS